MPEAELISLLGDLGFLEAQVTHRYDAFAGTSKEAVTKKFKVTGVNVLATKPR